MTQEAFCLCGENGPEPNCPVHGYEAVIATLQKEVEHLEGRVAELAGRLAEREDETLYIRLPREGAKHAMVQHTKDKVEITFERGDG